MEEGEGGLVSRLVYAAIISLETRPSPSSTRACSVSYNYAWEYFVGGGARGQKAWYILSRDACRDLPTYVDDVYL